MEAIWGFIHEPPAAPSPATVVDEVILTFNESVPSGTAINIQTGAYAGQVVPPTVEGSTTITLPTDFNTDAKIQAILNGLDLKKGGDISRTSATQVTMSDKLKSGDILKVRKFQ